MKPISTGRTDIGRSRKHNEDSFVCDDAIGLYVVADGVGGHAKGEIASAESVSQIQNWVMGARDARRAYLEAPEDEATRFAIRRTLESAVQQACYMVFGMAEMNPDQRGMSTTISALMILEKRAFIAQVGDSRVYLLRGGDAVQLTEDHTLINYKLKQGLITPEQAKQAKGKNVITRAVGHKEYVEVDNTQVDLLPGDRLLLCSDGLHGYLQDGELGSVIPSELSSDEACLRLIDLANQRGGKDNITAVMVEMVSDGADALLGR